MKHLRFAWILAFLIHPVLAQNVAERINYAHQYNPDEELQMKVVYGTRPSGELEVMIGLYHRDENRPLDYEFTFYGLEGYAVELEQNIIPPISSRQVGAMGNTTIHAFRFPQNIHKIIIAQVTSPVTGLSYYENIQPTDDAFPALLIEPSGLPALGSYVNEGRYDISAAVPLTVDYYDHEFPFALPPMTTKQPEVSRTLELTDSFEMDSTFDHIFSKTGLYVGKDMESNIRMVYRVEGGYYPEYVTIDDLIEPLVYITTRAERETLTANKEDKKSFDRFWLDMTGSKENAKWIIKNYYRRISEANTMFTSFKEGWKTDRGMLYVIFGPPDEVIRNGEQEYWNYKEGNDLPSLTFAFRTIRSPYAPRQYILNRDPRLSDDWMAAVKTWREGKPINDM
ncbi:MAG: GWxTD domain-containing protein [Cyclobacteriaceae bacterium]